MSAGAAPAGEPPWKRPESVLVVVHARGRALLLERADRAGFWQSVTGSLEWGEDPEAGARRELLEETGLVAAPERTGVSRTFVIYAHWRHRYAPGVKTNLEHEFRLELPAPVPVRLSPREHVRYEWVDLAEARERVFSWTNQDALRALARQG